MALNKKAVSTTVERTSFGPIDYYMRDSSLLRRLCDLVPVPCI
jgi:hypothetical protein